MTPQDQPNQVPELQCKNCKGYAYVPSGNTHHKPCPDCNGTGIYSPTEPNPLREITANQDVIDKTEGVPLKINGVVYYPKAYFLDLIGEDEDVETAKPGCIEDQWAWVDGRNGLREQLREKLK